MVVLNGLIISGHPLALTLWLGQNSISVSTGFYLQNTTHSSSYRIKLSNMS